MTRQPVAGQLPEIIYINGLVYSLYTTPLLHWLRKQDPSYVFDKRAPNCERGYIGKWKIEADILWLIGLYAWRNGRYTGIGALFDNRKEVTADWYSGPLIVEPTSAAIGDGEYPKAKTLLVEDGRITQV